MYPATYAASNPNKPAHIMAGSGQTVTYRELNDRSNRLAQLMWKAGLRPGDHAAIFMENHPRYLEVVWAALRSGLYLTTVNSYLTAREAAYIIDDCDARVLVTSRARAQVAGELRDQIPQVAARLMVDGVIDGYRSYEEAIAGHPATPLADEPCGELMLYSSGTTGKPKGIRRPLSGRRARDGFGLAPLLSGLFRFTQESIYLSPAPLYHSAPIGFSLSTQSLGGTVVVMEYFDPVDALQSVARYQVTHSQWVPTMFVRMLRLLEAERAGHDLSSMQVAVHAAAPCPVAVKEQVMSWWGPIVHEYYGATETNGLTYIGPEDWLQHRGSVGKAVFGELHILDDNGNELPSGEVGTIYFASPARFEYHKAPEQTRAAFVRSGWSTVGDIGYVDDAGYLYLTDRKAHMIISGGVNIYPREIEDVLVGHPQVADVAVFGVPNEDFGEEVKAVVQPVDMALAGPALADELMSFCRARLAHMKCPRSVDFEAELPRLPTGKLYKQMLRERYWAGHTTRIV
jgi:long-chain acyl-CoA synthetase